MLQEAVRALVPRPLAAPVILRVSPSALRAPGALQLLVQQLHDDGLMVVLRGAEIALYTQWTPLKRTGNSWSKEGAGAAEQDLHHLLSRMPLHVDHLRKAAAQLLRAREVDILDRFDERLAGYEQGVLEYGGPGQQLCLAAATALVEGYRGRLRACVVV